jgi:hypothetical protein
MADSPNGDHPIFCDMVPSLPRAFAIRYTLLAPLPTGYEQRISLLAA